MNLIMVSATTCGATVVCYGLDWMIRVFIP